MFKIDTSDKFEKKYKKILKKNIALKPKILGTMAKISQDPKYPSLKSHQVNHSEYGKVWSSWVHDDLRILWKYENDKIIILLLDIGSHDEVY
jgi:mRNA-degrading endonuclease YafQ of YafQ-DinJ toxin-antitoxin module